MSEMNAHLLDRFGNLIEPGATVTYPRHGSTLSVVDGVVTKIKYFPGQQWSNGRYSEVMIPRVFIMVDNHERYTEMLDRLTVVRL